MTHMLEQPFGADERLLSHMRSASRAAGGETDITSIRIQSAGKSSVVTITDKNILHLLQKLGRAVAGMPDQYMADRCLSRSPEEGEGELGWTLQPLLNNG